MMPSVPFELKYKKMHDEKDPMYTVCAEDGVTYAVKKINIQSQDHFDRINKVLNFAFDINDTYLMRYHFKVTHILQNSMEWCALIGMDYYEQNLKQFLDSHHHLFGNENFAIKVISDVFQGCFSLYKTHILHRNIKLENIFVKTNKKGNYVFILGDYEKAKRLDSKAECQSNKELSISHQPESMPPEEMEDNVYSVKGDIFSLGRVYYYLLFKQEPPFNHDVSSNSVDTYANYGNGFINQSMAGLWISTESKDFLQKCLQLNDKLRIDIKSVFNHPIFERACKIGGIINLNTLKKDDDEEESKKPIAKLK